MALPAQPQNLTVQHGNQQLYLSWSPVAGATSYQVQRSPDGINFSNLATASATMAPNYNDTTVTNGTQYWYQVAAINASGTGTFSSPVTDWPVVDGTETLGQIRLEAQRKADLENSNFIGLVEWNQNIYDSICALFDLLISCFGQDYYVATPLQFNSVAGQQSYALPNGTNYSNAPAFYKLLGVDIGVTAVASSAYLTAKRFNFIERNRYVFPQMGTTFMGIVSIRYRVVGSNLMFTPTPNNNQPIQLWYVPRPTRPIGDSAVVDGFAGWLEFVKLDAAIKAVQKQERDASLLITARQEIVDRITTMADNRDLGAPETISDTRSSTEMAGWGPPNGDGGYAGY